MVYTSLPAPARARRWCGFSSSSSTPSETLSRRCGFRRSPASSDRSCRHLRSARRRSSTVDHRLLLGVGRLRGVQHDRVPCSRPRRRRAPSAAGSGCAGRPRSGARLRRRTAGVHVHVQRRRHLGHVLRLDGVVGEDRPRAVRHVLRHDPVQAGCPGARACRSRGAGALGKCWAGPGMRRSPTSEPAGTASGRWRGSTARGSCSEGLRLVAGLPRPSAWKTMFCASIMSRASGWSRVGLARFRMSRAIRSVPARRCPEHRSASD